MSKQSDPLESRLEAETREFVERQIARLISERRLTPEEAPKAFARALADLSYLDELRLRRPARPDLVLPPLTIAPPPGMPVTSTWLDWYRRTHPLPTAPVCDDQPGNAS